MQRLLTLALPLVLAGSAAAQTPIGPFTGTESEGFETQTCCQFTTCIVGRVFNNNGDLCTPGNAGAHITGSWGFFCTIFPHSGTRLTGSAGGHYEYTFDSPVSRFGGYFGTNAGTADGVANFYDASNNFLGSAIITAPADCTWTWNGWQSNSPAGFSRIEIHSNTFGGAFMMMDDMEADFGPGTGPGTPFCFCDGSGTPAPCGNFGAAGNGCANSTNPSGANLSASGNADTANDTLVLMSSGATPGQPGLFFQGDTAAGGGSGIVFGDGLRCAAVNVVRLQIVSSDANGDAQSSVAIGATGGVSAGDVKHNQFWYRDPVGSPCGSTFNLTNGLTVTWL